MTASGSFRERFNELTKGKTLQQIADFLEMSVASIGYYRSGERSPKKPTIIYIAGKFGVNPYWLCGLDVPKIKEASKIKLEDLTDKQKECLALIMQMSEKQLDAFIKTAETFLSL